MSGPGRRQGSSPLKWAGPAKRVSKMGPKWSKSAKIGQKSMILAKNRPPEVKIIDFGPFLTVFSTFPTFDKPGPECNTLPFKWRRGRPPFQARKRSKITHFWPFFDPFLAQKWTRFLAKTHGRSPETGFKMGPKMGPKMGRKMVIFGPIFHPTKGGPL